MLKPLLAAAIVWLVWRWLARAAQARRSGKGRGPLTGLVGDAAEARAILGVAPGADAETIRAAHRRLVLGVHPDRGGSADLTRRVNAARDLLLRRG